MEYSKKVFFRLLKKHFGDYHEDGSTIVFHHVTKKEIAKALTMAGPQFNALLNLKEGKANNYKRVIERLIMYGNARAYKRVRKTAVLVIIAFSVVTVISGILGYFVGQRDSPEKTTIERQGQGIYCSPSPELHDIVTALGEVNVHRIIWGSVLIHDRIKGSRNILTRQDSLIAISNIMVMVENIVLEERKVLESLNFKFPSGKSLEVFFNEKFPTKVGAMFRLTPNEILNARNITDIQKKGSSYDVGVFLSYPHILNRKIGYLQVANEIRSVVERAQKYIIGIAELEARSEMVLKTQ